MAGRGNSTNLVDCMFPAMLRLLRDFSNNNFDGTIPSSWSALTNADFLWVAHTKLMLMLPLNCSLCDA